MKTLQPIKTVDKTWGSESWYHNSDRLCMKELRIATGKSCSLHYHILKEEIFRVLVGKVQIELIDTKTGRKETKILRVGESVLVVPNTPHRLTAMDGDALMLEMSTHHEDSDSYRIVPGTNDSKST
jgi:mannose-6-phosphate isomerase-like protein (cupin superfamily)